jgi:acetyl-CoA decarbonylase/synthase complex subunit gamma
MKLTGLQIFKMLPNKNCKECGFQTCLAFAMKLAAGQANLDDCPYISDEVREKLGAAAAPPIRLVKIGTGENEVCVGEELVLFRHEKTFFHKTAMAPQVHDEMAPEELRKCLNEITSFSIERAGETLCLDLVAVKAKSGAPEKFRETVKTVRENCPLPIILISENAESLRAALEVSAPSRPLLWGADKDNAEGMAALAKEFSVPLVVGAEATIEDLAKLAGMVEELGVQEIVLAPQSTSSVARLRDFTLLRRRALERSLKGTGFPTIMAVNGLGFESAIAATAGICKYASVIVMEHTALWEYLPLLTLRQNIYTDPQKPLQVEAAVYRIGETDDDAPLFVTTNFSLTYFMVSTEIEASEIPSKLLIVEAEGQSVLTAWAAGKFGAEHIAKAVQERELEKSVSHKSIIIPGYVAMMSGDLEDKLPGWNIMVGPQESADIPSYMKEVWAKTAKS